MRLNSLHIKGFKSFADNTTIHFNENITGVVGPNGCGKSNVVDAIRWVLGEQKSSQLRSDKMENIIFNGTKKRKSSHLAEVTLTFENTRNVLPVEYAEVAISRRLYRNGDSEYRINDIPCRLKDITSLFLDTGVGSDSYAIMELSMIDDILNDKDNSRRMLLEQAAGISKYKTRKKETLNKLRGTENDLNRVEDLLFEIESNLKTLERQARKAKRYMKLKEQYKELSIELAIHTLSEYKKTFERLQDDEETQKDKVSKFESEISRIEAELEKEKTQNIKKEKALSGQQKELNAAIEEIRHAENNKNILKEKINLFEERICTLQNEISEAGERKRVLSENIQKLTKDKDEEKLKLEKIIKETEQKKQRVEETKTIYEEQKDTLNNSKSILKEAQNRIYEVEKLLAVNRTRLDNLNNEYAEGKKAFHSGNEELKKILQDLKEIAVQIKGHEKNLQHLKSEESAYGEKINKIKGEKEEIHQQLVKENRFLDARENEYKLTKSLVDNLEGFPESIKFLKKNASWTKKAPLLSDIINCDDEYRPVIESYLEPYLNYYVVDNFNEAVSAINLLSDAAKGRANFFVLEELKNFKPEKPVDLKEATPAIELIDTEKKYLPLSNFLLNKVYVSETIESDEKPDDVIIITKNGKFIRKPYALSGGAVGLFEGKRLGRVKNLQKLKKDIEKAEKRIFQLKQQLESKDKELQKLERERQNHQKIREEEKLQELYHTRVSLRTKEEHFESQIKLYEQREKSVKERLQNIEKENEQLQNELKEKSGISNEKAGKVKVLEEDFIKLENKYRELSEDFNKANIHFHQQQNKYNSIEQQLEFELKQKKSAEEMAESGSLQLNKIRSESKNAEIKVRKIEELLEKKYTIRDNQQQELDKLEEAYYKSRGDLNEKEEHLRELGRKKQQDEVVLTSVKDKINELKIELNGLKDRLSIEFKLDIDDLLDRQPDNEYDKEDLNEKVEKIKSRIYNFGEINPIAVEAYDEMKKRYDFINEQKNDLLEAKASLMETIGEIEEIATTQFMKAFKEVKENFIDVFQTLFTAEEENCDMFLKDESSPLESPIEIIAKPKGKRPLTINQLSGGEKALTALAMLFALYLLKPAPFCILDEVDAPLDDTNIGKFNDLIRRFSEKSQFIIVTHNKQTMASVDIIYGVTMAEQGVSKVVPVDFRELKVA